jgi:DNA polymerase-3 subunit gamma/tau
MSDYQVIARKFRPQSFKDVIGQEAIVTTLKNAIKSKRLAQAYLFCGSRGTGKTTLARLLAKALNCQQPTPDCEPCNQCSCCREIISGMSLDVLEIDGASHRGIEDIRQINETVGYASSGHYKVYIIDEVHMLTKEAFNALLKTLEEPPPKVKFFFATTEPHKVLPTILSRCQRFNLSRIPQPLIVTKLRHIAHQLGVEVEEDALRLLAQRAEGGLRDAESLFDQILAFEEGCITLSSVTAILGLMPREIYFEIDQAGKEGQFIKAFEIAHRVFSEGKDLTFFIEGLIDHLRQILLVKLSGVNSSFMTLTDSEKEKYAQAASLYSREQCLDLIEYLIEAQNQLRTTPFGKTSLETILLHVMRSHFRLSIEQLVRHLSELEQMVNEKNESTTPVAPQPSIPPKASAPTPPTMSLPSSPPMQAPAPKPPFPVAHAPKPASLPAQMPIPAKIAPTPPPVAKAPPPPPPTLFESFTTEDPTPTPADLGKSPKIAKPSISSSAPPPTKISPAPSQDEAQRPMHAYDTLMHFAAVELDGRLQKN